MSTSIALKPSELGELVSECTKTGDPLLVEGPPGIGKTEVISQATSAAGCDMIVSHPVVSDQTKAEGMPWVWQSEDGPRALFIPIGEIALVYAATKPTVWFVDDVGQAPPAVQASFMGQLHPPTFNGKRIAVNGHAIPECVTMIAATNRRTDRAGVTGILEPVKGRFLTIVQMQADLDEFCQWSIDKGVVPEVRAYVRWRPDQLSDFQPSADMSNSPTPRGWWHVSKIMKMKLSPKVRRAAIGGAVGEGAATDFATFLSMMAQLPSIDGILINPDAAAIPTEPGALYAVATALGAKATAANFNRVVRYAHRLAEADRGDFAALIIRDAGRRQPELMDQTNPEFVKLASSELGQLIVGAL